MSYKLSLIISCLLTLSGIAREQKITAALFSSAIGDALGRVTEFIPSTREQFKKYPRGVTSFDDFTSTDWDSLPISFQTNRIAPYTDDTRMALLVADVLVHAKKRDWDKDTTMSHIARAFIEDLENAQYGWGASYRAPGNACLTGTYALKKKNQNTAGWWDVNAQNAGGCGSVMRAFPFGLVYCHNPRKAALWAAEHSKLTHGAPLARASCAAMAYGVAQCIATDNDVSTIVDEMIEQAAQYDSVTAKKMREARDYAKHAKQLRGSLSVEQAMKNDAFRAHHEHVFAIFQGWAAHDAIAASIYTFLLYPRDIRSALFVGVHTPGDSDSIAAMSGALVGAYSGEMPDSSLVNRIEGSDRMKAIARHIVS